MNAPTLVPTSPVTEDPPVTLNAPAAVNKAKLDVAPKLGAVCPKHTIGSKNSTTADNVLSSLDFINVLFFVMKVLS